MEFPENYVNAVVFPSREFEVYFHDDPRFDGFLRFYAEEGAKFIRGIRFKSIWIHWDAHKAPKYEELRYTVLDSLIKNPLKFKADTQLFF